MLHEKWKDYTEEEIEKIKKNKCIKCPYHSGMLIVSGQGRVSYKHITCDYMYFHGKRREVRPEDCQSYKDKKKTKGVKFYG